MRRLPLGHGQRALSGAIIDVHEDARLDEVLEDGEDVALDVAVTLREAIAHEIYEHRPVLLQLAGARQH